MSRFILSRLDSPAALALVGGGAFAAIALWLKGGDPLLDPDSAMRLVQVRDLLAGQSWFDLTQTRMNPPQGLFMHWSRLVDAPLVLLDAVTGSQSLMMAAWPLLLFAGLAFVVARLALAMGGRAAMRVSVVLLLLCAALWGLFSPGVIDHHNLVLLLMMTALLGLVEQRPVLAAVAVALGLGVALECLPYTVLAVLMAALWLRDAPHLASRFGIAMALAALVLWLGTGGWRAVPVCDSYSGFYAAELMLGGVGLAAVARLPRHRFAGLAVLAALLVGAALLVNPVCLGGPYAGMDPRLGPIFLSRINEAQPIWRFAVLAPSEALAGFGYGVFALAATLAAPRSRARMIVLSFAGMALLVSIFQIRGVPFAVAFALPGLAAALVAHARGLLLVLAVLVCGDTGFAIAGTMVEGQEHLAARIAAFGKQRDCASAFSIALLARQPGGTVAAFVDQGPAILARTGDRVLAGPYHRDAAGILDTYALFAGPDPKGVAARRSVDYVMTCAAAPDWNFYRVRGGLIARLAEGRTPDWLTPLGRAGDVRLYRVSR